MCNQLFVALYIKFFMSKMYVELVQWLETQHQNLPTEDRVLPPYTSLCTFLGVAGGGGADGPVQIFFREGGALVEPGRAELANLSSLFRSLISKCSCRQYSSVWKLTDPGKLIVVPKHFLILVPGPASQDAFS
jgi:hypothetical protein